METPCLETPTKIDELVTRAYVYMYGQFRVNIEAKDAVVEMFGEKFPEVLGAC